MKKSVAPLTLAIARRFLPRRKKDANKGDCGRVYIIAGSKGMAGAAVLCATGAVRSGAGLVRLGIVASQQSVAVRRAPLEITTQPLPEDKNGRLSGKAWTLIAAALKKFKPDVIAAGPGLGLSPAIQKIIFNLLFRSSIPVVLDADGLNILAKMKISRKASAPVILTPHPGELARILSVSPAAIQRDRPGSAAKGALKWGGVCLLKGAGTIVTDGRTFYRNTTGNPGMASGGMGDVLTGIIAALWGQFQSLDQQTGLQAACAGAYLHGLTGDLASRRFPIGTLLASDLADELPAAMGRLRK